MSASPVDHVVSDYLNRLDVAAGSLPPARRAELLQEIREHIDAARAAGAAADVATVRTMLDRLGEPEEIVAAALEAAPAQQSGFVSAQPSTGLELAAALLLTVGSFVPLICWAVGAVLLWGSRRWSTREKLLGTLVVPGGPAMAIWLGLYFPGQTCVETQGPGGVTDVECTGYALPLWAGIPLFLVVLVAPLIVAGLLYSRAKARADAEEPILRPAGSLAAPTTAWTGQEIAAVLVLAVGGILAMITGPFGVVAAAVAAAAGLTLTWTSSGWARREQLTATVIVGAVTAAAIALGAVVLLVEGSGLALFPVLILLPIGFALGLLAAAGYLTVVLNRHRAEIERRRVVVN